MRCRRPARTRPSRSPSGSRFNLRQRRTACGSSPSEFESGGEDRSPHVDVKAQIAVICRIVKVEAAIPQMKVDRRVDGVVDRADQLPVGMRADAETAEIAIGAQAEAIIEIVVIASGEQRIAPAAGATYVLTRKLTGVQLQIRSKSPSAEA